MSAEARHEKPAESLNEHRVRWRMNLRNRADQDDASIPHDHAVMLQPALRVQRQHGDVDEGYGSCGWNGPGIE
jgi:hypothetical protein